MPSRVAQYLIAMVFLILGGWALLSPQTVIDLAFTPAYSEDSFLVRFCIACFGAQACLFGIMALAVHFTARSFLVLALALLPFFVFDWYFHWVVPVLTPVGMLDLLGNLIMLGLCLYGWRRALHEERTA